MKNIIAMILITVVISACALNNNRCVENECMILSEKLERLNIDNPDADVIQNIKEGKLSFIGGVFGYSCTAPGVGDRENILVKKYGLDCLNGVTDHPTSNEYANIIGRFKKYAIEYNQGLINHCVKLNECNK